MEPKKIEVQKSLQEIKSTANFKIQLPQYANIELTQDEIAEALRVARKLKDAEIRNKEYWEKVRNPPQLPVYTPDQMGLMIVNLAKKQMGIDFKITNNVIINSLLQYFCNEKGYFDENKGIMLSGGVGVGKTTLMKLFAQNQKSSFIVVSCRKVAQDYVSGGDDGKGGFKAIEKYWKPFITTANEFGHKERGMCFDDLGTESDKSHFGNHLNAMAEVILNRYDNQDLVGMTHFTTNLSGDEIEKYYGTRVRSRMREMVNKFDFKNAVDLRK
jgi:hypothetical protein